MGKKGCRSFLSCWTVAKGRIEGDKSGGKLNEDNHCTISIREPVKNVLADFAR